MNRWGIISECAIEIGTDVSCEIIYPKRIIQNLNQLLDPLPDQAVIVGHVRQAFSNANET